MDAASSFQNGPPTLLPQPSEGGWSPRSHTRSRTISSQASWVSPPFPIGTSLPRDSMAVSQGPTPHQLVQELRTTNPDPQSPDPDAAEERMSILIEPGMIPPQGLHPEKPLKPKKRFVGGFIRTIFGRNGKKGKNDAQAGPTSNGPRPLPHPPAPPVQPGMYGPRRPPGPIPQRFVQPPTPVVDSTVPQVMRHPTDLDDVPEHLRAAPQRASSHSSIRFPQPVIDGGSGHLGVPGEMPEADEDTPRPHAAVPSRIPTGARPLGPRSSSSHSGRPVLSDHPALSRRDTTRTSAIQDTLSTEDSRAASRPISMQVDPQPAEDYRRMNKPGSGTSSLGSSFLQEPSFSTELNTVQGFFSKLYRLPWVNPTRITADYRPGLKRGFGWKRVRVRSGGGGVRSGGNRRSFTAWKPIPKPMRSWYFRGGAGKDDKSFLTRTTSLGRTTTTNVDLLSSGTSPSSSRSYRRHRRVSSPQSPRHRRFSTARHTRRTGGHGSGSAPHRTRHPREDTPAPRHRRMRSSTTGPTAIPVPSTPHRRHRGHRSGTSRSSSDRERSPPPMPPLYVMQTPPLGHAQYSQQPSPPPDSSSSPNSQPVMTPVFMPVYPLPSSGLAGRSAYPYAPMAMPHA